MTTCSSEREKLFELEEAVNRSDLGLLLQVFAENVDLGACLPSSVSCFTRIDFFGITSFNRLIS